MRDIKLLCLGSTLALSIAACGEDRSGEEQTTETDSNSGASASDGPSTTSGMADDGLDDSNDESGLVPTCVTDSSCDLIDLLFVIDNSGTMGEEQLNLAANLSLLVDQLNNLTDRDGNAVNPNINIMVTTSDYGHPLCTPFQDADYTPRQGAPVYEGCNSRISRFTGLEDPPTVIEEACTQFCPADIAPQGAFIHFDVEGTNVPMDNVAAALSCIGPQGIDGCGYEAPLETMLQAANPSACWNDPRRDECQEDGSEYKGLKKGFLRRDATLAVAIITDEADCSVRSPNGYEFFTDKRKFWETNPDIDTKQATSAICWNAGVECTDDTGDGTYESCVSRPTSALHETKRYIDYLQWLRSDLNKEVVMLGIVGIPPVTEHNPDPPFQPTMGGVADLVYRDWVDGEFPAGDILPDEFALGKTADHKRFEFGAIGPGCTGQNGSGDFTGQAIPPVRIREVCESLNYEENGENRVRCCMESICDDDFSAAIKCLSGIIQDTIVPQG